MQQYGVDPMNAIGGMNMNQGSFSNAPGGNVGTSTGNAQVGAMGGFQQNGASAQYNNFNYGMAQSYGQGAYNQGNSNMYGDYYAQQAQQQQGGIPDANRSDALGGENNNYGISDSTNKQNSSFNNNNNNNNNNNIQQQQMQQQQQPNQMNYGGMANMNNMAPYNTYGAQYAYPGMMPHTYNMPNYMPYNAYSNGMYPYQQPLQQQQQQRGSKAPPPGYAGGGNKQHHQHNVDPSQQQYNNAGGAYDWTR